MPGSSTIEELPQQQDQVFINFRGVDLHYGFVSHLVKALKSSNINVLVDNYLDIGEPIEALLKRIEESRIVLVILSMEYTDSVWCMIELTKIKDCVEKGKLVAIPIFYKLDPSTVQEMSGKFGRVFKKLPKSDARKKWKKCLKWIPSRVGHMVQEESSKGDKIIEIVKAVEKVLMEIPSEGSQKAYVDMSDNQTSSLQHYGAGTRYGFVSHFVKGLESYKFRNQPGIRIGCLLLLFFVLLQIAYMSISLIYQDGAMSNIVENVQRVQECIPTEGTKNPIENYTESLDDVGATRESSTSDAKTNAEFLDRTFTSPMDSKVKPPQIQVFINFRGEQLRYNFVGYLVDALQRNEINVFIDNQAQRGEDLNSLFKRIEDSGIAIVVFSSRYTESIWCLEELVKIKERVHQGLLKVLPIFYRVSPTNVKRLKGDFGDHFRDKEYTYESDEPMIKRWKEAITFVSHKFALTLDEKSSVLEIDFVETIVKEVLKMLLDISTVESGQSSS